MKIYKAYFIMAFFLLFSTTLCNLSCSSKGSSGDISEDLSERMTDALNFEGGQTIDEEPPTGLDDPEAPQLTNVENSPLRLGAGFSFSLFSSYSNISEVSHVILFVEGSNRYLKISGDLFNGTMNLFGKLGDDLNLAGKTFKLFLALQTKNNVTGEYYEISVKVSENSTQEFSETDLLNLAIVQDELNESMPRPQANADVSYPQIDKIAAPFSVKPGQKYTVELYTSSDFPLTHAILTTPKNDFAKFISIAPNPTQGVITIEIEFSSSEAGSYQLLYLWALKSEDGAGLYSPWGVLFDNTDGPDGDLDYDDEIADIDLSDVDILDEDNDNDFIEYDAEPETELVPPYPIWSHHYGDSSINQFGRDIAAGSDGSSFLVGDFDNTVTIGENIYTSNGLSDIILAKFDNDGNPIWSKAFGDDRRQSGTAIAVDSSDNIIVTGYFSGVLTIEETILESGSTLETSVFVAKFTTDGNLAWAKSFGSTDEWQRAEAISVDDSDNIYITGNMKGSINFGGETLTSVGNEDAFIVKFDDSGTHQWSKHFGDAANQYGKAIATLNSNQVFLLGDFFGNMNFDDNILTSESTSDIYLAVFNASTGTVIWASNYGDAGEQYSGDIAVSGSGDIYITGSNYSTIKFDTFLNTEGDSDMFLAKISPNNIPLWSKSFGDIATQWGDLITIDEDSNICICGRFNGEINFGGSTFVNPSGKAIVIALFNENGEHIWSKGYGPTGENVPIGLDQWKGQRIYMTGAFDTQLNFFPMQPLYTYGENDIFVASLGY